MDSLQFDYLHGWAVVICAMAWLAAAVVPVVTCLRAGRPLAVLCGALLSVTGTLFYLRAESSLQNAAQFFLVDLHATLPAALMLAVLVLVWTGIWNVVMPQLLEAATRASSVGWALLWLAGGLVSVYLAVFVFGGLPGALARGLGEQRQKADMSTKELHVQLQDARKANAAALCSFAGEGLRLLKGRGNSEPARMTRSEWLAIGKNWGIEFAGKATLCTTQAERLTLVQAKAALGELTVALQRGNTGVAPKAPTWVDEPKSIAKPTGLADMKLGAYFEGAFLSPVQHVKRLFADLDLAVTFVLLGELAVAVLGLLDVCLQRRSDRSVTPEARQEAFIITDR